MVETLDNITAFLTQPAPYVGRKEIENSFGDAARPTSNFDRHDARDRTVVLLPHRDGLRGEGGSIPAAR